MYKFKSLLLAELLLVISAGSAFATQIGFSGIPSARLVKNAQDTTLTSSNSLVLAGTFATPTAFTLNIYRSLQQNFTSAVSNGGWEQFGIDTTTNPLNTTGYNDGVVSNLQISAGANPGRIAGAVQDNNFGSTKADFFNNKPIYVWIFNAPTIAAATQMGIFRATDATQPWTFPTNAGGIGDVVTSFSTAPGGAPTIAAIGGFGTGGSTLKLTDQFNIQAAPLPEASTALFGLLTLFVTATSRKRRI